MGTFIGRKVRLKTHNSEDFIGYLNSVDEKYGRLTLGKVESMITKKKLPGLQHFFPADIKECIVIEDEKKVNKKKVVATDCVERTNGPKLLDRKETPSHLKRLRELDKRELVEGRRKSSSDEATPPNDAKEGPYPTLKGDLASQLPKKTRMKYAAISFVGEDFKEAIETIKEYNTIGFAAEGAEMGRHGTLIWIQIGLPEYVILFDIKMIGTDAFKYGLKKIIESPAITKVINNCRAISDLLYHQYRINLRNVFDTQVADSLQSREENGQFSRYVRPFHALVPEYLSMPVETIMKHRTRAEHKKQDAENFWGARPPSENCLHVACHNAMYLLALKEMLLDALLQPFYNGVDIYLSCVRDASEKEYKKYAEELHMVPGEFRDLGSEARRCRDRSRAINKTQDDGDEFIEKCEFIPDPKVIFSHDSIWHAGETSKPITTLDRAGRSRARAREHARSKSAVDTRRVNSRSPSLPRKKTETIVGMGREELNRRKGDVFKSNNAPMPNSAAQAVLNSGIKDKNDDRTTMIEQSPAYMPSIMQQSTKFKPAGGRHANIPEPHKVVIVAGGAESATCTVKESEIVRELNADEIAKAQIRDDVTKCTIQDDEDLGNIPDIGKYSGKATNLGRFQNIWPSAQGTQEDGTSNVGNNDCALSSGEENPSKPIKVTGRLPKCASKRGSGYTSDVSNHSTSKSPPPPTPLQNAPIPESPMRCSKQTARAVSTSPPNVPMGRGAKLLSSLKNLSPPGATKSSESNRDEDGKKMVGFGRAQWLQKGPVCKT